MRIIAGLYRGRVLKSPPGLQTRPTSDRLRETLFNILKPRITLKSTVLDLCAGTGAVGIEALSRGASFVSFVDISRKMCFLIKENLANLKVPEHSASVSCEKAERYLSKIESPFDIIFFDPPYQNSYSEALNEIGKLGSRVLSENGVLTVEHASSKVLPDEIGTLLRRRIVKQGDSSLSFYELPS